MSITPPNSPRGPITDREFRGRFQVGEDIGHSDSSSSPKTTVVWLQRVLSHAKGFSREDVEQIRYLAASPPKDPSSITPELQKVIMAVKNIQSTSEFNMQLPQLCDDALKSLAARMQQLRAENHEDW